jgi:hypothetical protein
MNAYIELLQQAHEKQWCIQEFCTTCGSMEFRNTATALAHQEGNQLVASLASLKLSELYRFSKWHNALYLSLYCIDKAEDMDTVLTSWLPQLDAHIRIADLVLFYFVRRGALFAPMSIEVLEQWRGTCVDLAVRTNDESLVESLICTEGRYYRNYPELAEVVQGMVERGSSVITKALRRNGVVT